VQRALGKLDRCGLLGRHEISGDDFLFIYWKFICVTDESGPIVVAYFLKVRISGGDVKGL